MDAFLRPLAVTAEAVHRLSREFRSTFEQLAAESTTMFLSTPISEAILRPVVGRNDEGR